MSERWWTTARLGDRFTHPEFGECLLTHVGDDYIEGRILGEWSEMYADEKLPLCTPLHAENLRRHMAGVAEATGEVKSPLGVILRRDDGKWSGYNWAWLEPRRYESALDAAQEVVPDDWNPAKPEPSHARKVALQLAQDFWDNGNLNTRGDS